MEERNWVTSLKARVWKLHGIKKGMGKGSCPLSLQTAYVQHTLLHCLETRAKNAISYKKWLDMNEKVAYSKTE
jgi:hypothetical protein